MQQLYRSKPHRTTIWRRFRDLRDTERRAGTVKLGRAFADKRPAESFLRFTAAVIQTVNETGRCDYSDLEKSGRTGFGFKYRDSDSAIFSALAGCDFPAALLAVAICDLVPQNLHTPRKPRRTASDVARVNVQRKKTSSNYASEYQRERFIVMLRRDGYDRQDIKRYISELDKTGWPQNILSFYGENIHTEKGTPPHRIPFSGVKLSKRMTHYWRRHTLYDSCKTFLSAFFTRPIPKVPSDKLPASIDHQITAHFKAWFKLRQKTTPQPQPV